MEIISATKNDAQIIANIVALSNKDVALKFGIDKNNNPKHPSFYNENWVLSDFERGEEYFLLQHEGQAIACVAFEPANSEVGYLNRLSVLPSFRKQGIGEMLTQHVLQYGKSKGMSVISIGVIAKHVKLIEWYAKMGFQENGIKVFPHLPFDVLFMKYDL